MSYETGDGRYEDTMYQRFHRNQTVNNQQVNQTLTTQRFYGTAPAVLDQPGPSRPVSTYTPSTYAPSDSSQLFSLPNSTEKFREWTKVEPVVNNFCRGFRFFEMHKNFLKLWVSSSNEILDMATKQSPINLEFSALVNTFCDHMKARFPSNIPRPSPSLVSSHPSVLDFGSVSSLPSLLNDERSMVLRQAPNNGEQQNQLQHQALYKPSVPYQVANSLDGSMAFQQRNTIPALYQPQVMLNKASVPHQQLNLKKGSDTSQTLSGSSTQAVNSSNEESAAFKQPLPRKKRRSPSSKEIKENSLQVIKDNKKNTSTQAERKSTLDASVLNGSKAISKFGRQIRSPQQYWKGLENNESMFIDFSKRSNGSKQSPDTTQPAEDLNETIVLRNNRKVVKNTPVPKNAAKNRKNMYETIQEDDESKKGNKKKPQSKKPVNRKSLTRENKENISNPRENSKRSETTKKKSEATKVQVEPKPKQKRKSNSEDTTFLKRRKIEEASPKDNLPLDSDSDELFEPYFPKKKILTSAVTQVVSPNSGMHSVKKALAAASSSKETPPAKLISTLIGKDSAPPSAAKPVPESTVSHVVNRISKMMSKKSPKKASKAKQSKAKGKDDEKINQIINSVIHSSHSNQHGDILTVFRENTLAEPDFEDDSIYSDNDDLL